MSSIENNWKMVRKIFESANSSWHKTVSTVSSDGTPHSAPIGAFFLRENTTGYFFDSFLKKTAENLEFNKNVCVLAVNSDFIYWKRSLESGKFDTPPSVRLYGKALGKRSATAEELKIWHEQISFFEGTLGYDKLWKDMSMVWDLEFNSFKPTCLPGEMLNEQWMV
jgi:uncharacterized protein